MLKTTISRLRSLNTFHSLSNISSNTLPASQQTRSAHTSRHKPDEVYDNNFIYNKDPDKPPRLFVVQPRLRPETALNAKLSEALNLANSLEEQRDGYFVGDMCDKESPSHVVVQNPGYGSSKRHSDTYFGPGTVKDIKCHLNVAEEKDEVDAVFVNSILSGIQQRNLEREWGKPVLDRVGLIIEIFNAHAQTKEGKLQSELAALMYKKTRLVRVKGPGGKLSFGASGEAEVVSARGRGSGGRGFISGAGETELQLQRRRILERRNQLLSEIEEVRRTRALQRASRRRRGGSQGQGLSTVAIVGYTNAGKSTLVNALSESGDLYSDDRLFATVDPRVRSVILPSGRKVLVSDTVGFISDLPVQLVDAFHATLEEVVEADLLVHVIDSSAVNLEDQRSSVLEVLQQIGVSEEKLQNMIEVWNKIDLRGHVDDANDSLNEAEFEESDFTETEYDMETDAPQEASTDEDEEGGFTKTEDGMNSDSSLEESIDKDNSMPGENDDNVEVGVNTSSEDWIAINYQQDSTEKWKIVDDQQGASSELSKAADDKMNAVSHNQNHQRIEVSAVMGVGLQELLNAVDEKLEEQNVVKRSRIDGLGRKWRPPRNADTDTAIGH